jgi:hypothetical protein
LSGKPFIEEITIMWKIALGFVAFAALALFVIFKAGDKVDMSGEKHGTEAIHASEEAKPNLRRGADGLLRRFATRNDGG